MREEIGIFCAENGVLGWRLLLGVIALWLLTEGFRRYLKTPHGRRMTHRLKTTLTRERRLPLPRSEEER